MSLPVHLVAVPGRGRRAARYVEVTGDEAHHAVAVRRLAVGEQVVLTDGAGTLGHGVGRVDGQAGLLRRRSTSVAPSPARSRPSPSCRRCPRASAASWRSRCSPRSASTGIVPWAAARSVAVWKGERADEVAGQVAGHRPRGGQAGAPARGSPRSPRWPPPPTSSALVAEADLALVLHEDASAPLAGAARSRTAGRIVVVVGPRAAIEPTSWRPCRRRRRRRTPRCRGPAHLHRRGRRRRALRRRWA